MKTDSRVALRTRRSLLPQIIELIKQEHPYEVPSVVAVPIIDGGADYLRWILEEPEGRTTSITGPGCRPDVAAMMSRGHSGRLRSIGWSAADEPASRSGFVWRRGEPRRRPAQRVQGAALQQEQRRPHDQEHHRPRHHG